MKQIKNFLLTILFLMLPALFFSQEAKPTNYKIFYPETSSPKAVCMVIHGLNLKPTKMNWVIDQLLKQDAIVVNVELWGHGNNPVVVTDSLQQEGRMEAFKEVTWNQWMKDTKAALDTLEMICEERQVPAYFFGFSLGALVGSSMSFTYDFQFDKYLLLAPAIKIKFWPRLSIGLFNSNRNKVIKSRSPMAYRDNEGTPVAAYKALVKGAKTFKENNPDLGNCIIIVDKKDRLVSAKKLRKYTEQHNYSISIIEKSKLDCKYCDISHLVIDKPSLGEYSIFVSEKIQSVFQ